MGVSEMTLSEFDIFQINENVFFKGSVLHTVTWYWFIHFFEIELVMSISRDRAHFTLYTFHYIYVYAQKSSRNKKISDAPVFVSRRAKF